MEANVRLHRNTPTGRTIANNPVSRMVARRGIGVTEHGMGGFGSEAGNRAIVTAVVTFVVALVLIRFVPGAKKS